MNQKEIPATATASRRPIFKIRLFTMQILLLAIVTFLMAGSDLARWRELSEVHVSARGMTLVKAVEPHVIRYISENDHAGLENMVRSMTSEAIPNNDLVSVQILDTDMNKLAEATPHLGPSQTGYLHLPATVVVANPVTSPQTKQQIGILRMVFSNRYFEDRSRAVIQTTVFVLLLGTLLAALITWLIGRMIQNPVTILAEAASKMAGGDTDVQLELDTGNEIGVLVEAFNLMSQRVNVHLSELRQKNLQLENRNFELSTLQQIGRSLSSILDQEMVYETIVDNVINVLSGVKRCSLLLVDEKRNEFIFRVTKGLDPEVVPENGRMPIDSGIAAKVFHTGEAVLLNDLDEADDTRRLEGGKVVRSSICAPIMIGGQVVGVLSLSNKISGVAFTEADLRLVEGLAIEAALAIKNARMWQDLKRKVLELNTLHEVGKNLGLVLDINKLLELVIDHSARRRNLLSAGDALQGQPQYRIAAADQGGRRHCRQGFRTGRTDNHQRLQLDRTGNRRNRPQFDLRTAQGQGKNHRGSVGFRQAHG